MKLPRASRLTVLAAAAGTLLLAWVWPEAPHDATPPAAQKRPRGAHGTAVAATPASRPSPTTAPRARSEPPSDRAASLAALDTTLIAQRAGSAGTATNAFAARSWFVAPPPPPPQPEAPPPPPPPPPQAPPLPFKYMGSMQESPERTVWYLRQGDRLIVAGPGDIIDSTYRTEGVEAGRLRFTYLPLNQRQTLSIGVAP